MSSMVVKQVADAKFYEYGMRNNGNGVCDRKQQLQSGKKMALRDLPNETGNMVLRPQGNSPVQKDGDGTKPSGTKRAKPTCSNPQCQQSACSCSKENLVYVRRKLETDSLNLNVYSDGGLNLDAHTEEKIIAGLSNELQGSNVSQFLMFGSTPLASLQSCSLQEPLFPHALAKVGGNVASGEPKNTTTCPTAVDSQGKCIQHWMERFVRLQIFLKQCDEANRDEYVQMLRSLSATGRSRHAVELEKRAIHLLLEEGKELHRMKFLNVLGRSIPKNLAPSTSQPHSVQAVSENDVL